MGHVSLRCSWCIGEGAIAYRVINSEIPRQAVSMQEILPDEAKTECNKQLRILKADVS
jgi:hypothetical protein